MNTYNYIDSDNFYDHLEDLGKEGYVVVYDYNDNGSIAKDNKTVGWFSRHDRQYADPVYSINLEE